MEWYSLALISMIGFSLITLIQKYLLNWGIHPIVFGFYLLLFGTIGFFITASVKKQSLAIPHLWLILLIAAGIIALIANITATTSFQSTPNIGYTQIIVSASGIVIFLASFILFDSKFDLTKTIGVILATIGLVIMGFGNGD